MLRLAAVAERVLEHPLARAVVDGATEHGLPLSDPADFESVTGQGIDAGVLAPAAEQLARTGRTPILVAVDGRPAGALEGFR
ncbi:hypothetical protein [Nonomuraea sp. NPDC049607]|uniref:hypothetical protein n=1 Tax=Nonomuraea sp. NPDC049607 TaxID=3154732 RepID=UPI00341FFE26